MAHRPVVLEHGDGLGDGRELLADRDVDADEAFAQFASDLDKATRDQLTRGEKLSEVVKQPQYQPLAVEKQVAILYAATSGKLDDIPTPRVKEFETQLYRFLETERPNILEELGRTNALTDDLQKALDEAIDEFRQTFLA